jgi:integrase
MKNDKRREYGTGSVHQECNVKKGCPPLVDGPPHPKTGKPTKVRPLHEPCRGRWVGSLEAGTTAKGTRRRPKVVGKTEAEVRRKLRDKRRDVELHGVTEVSSRATVRSWGDEWLKIVQRTLAPNSYTPTRTAVTKWIVPTIGHKRFADLTPAHVRAVHDAMREHVADSTRVRHHWTLMSMLKAALLEGHPVSPRVLAVPAPAAGTNDRTDMELEEAIAVMGAAAESLPHASRFAGALLQGVRQGESIGLTWDECDFKTRRVTLSWQVQPLPYNVKRDRTSGFRVPDGYEYQPLCLQNADGQWVPAGTRGAKVMGQLCLVRPKSSKSWRVLPMVPWFHDALLAWREIAPPSPHGLVWPKPDGQPRTTKADDEEWYGLQKAAGVRHPSGERFYTIHETRHTTATLLMEADVDPHIITAILGHSSIVTSRGYQHAGTKHTMPALQQVAERLQLVG